MQKYDFLIVGAGLFGSVFAYEAWKKKKKCLVIDQRDHIGGNCYQEGYVHKYGPHIFHTNDKAIWDYVNGLVEFKPYINQVMANVGGEIYNLPFNMNLFSKVFNVTKPIEAKKIIDNEIKKYGVENPENMEQKLINCVGQTLYLMFIRDYTEKQWGRKCSELPAFIGQRIPVRYTYDNNYYYDTYQGIPENYNELLGKLISSAELKLNTKYDKSYRNIAKAIIYTGMIDEYYDYRFGELEYRSLDFKMKKIISEESQGCAVMNYPTADIKYTRTVEHKYFSKVESQTSIVGYEYPMEYKKGLEPYYPINDVKNKLLYIKYSNIIEPDVFFAGRLGSYSYNDMDDTIALALKLVKNLI